MIKLSTLLGSGNILGGGNKPVKNIVNGLLTPPNLYASNWCPLVPRTYLQQVGKVIDTGAITRNVFKTLIEVTGAGEINLLGISGYGNSGGAGMISIKLTIDGTVAFFLPSGILVIDSTNFVSIIGAIIGSNGSYNVASCTFERVFFSSSFKVEVTHVNDATDAHSCCINYKTY